MTWLDLTHCSTIVAEDLVLTIRHIILPFKFCLHYKPYKRIKFSEHGSPRTCLCNLRDGLSANVLQLYLIPFVFVCASVCVCVYVCVRVRVINIRPEVEQLTEDRHFRQ